MCLAELLLESLLLLVLAGPFPLEMLVPVQKSRGAEGAGGHNTELLVGMVGRPGGRSHQAERG